MHPHLWVTFVDYHLWGWRSADLAPDSTGWILYAAGGLVDSLLPLLERCGTLECYPQEGTTCVCTHIR